MKSASDIVRELLDHLPDDVSLEQIQYHLHVHQKIERGLKDLDEGRTVSQKEMERRMAKWLRQSELGDR